MAESHPPSPVPNEVAAAQEPWPGPEGAGEGPDGDEPDAEAPVPDPGDEEDVPPTATVLARVAGEQLGRLGGIAQFGLIVLGGLLALNLSGPAGGARGPFPLLLALALTGLVALVVGQALRGFGALLHAVADQSEATGRVASGLEQLTAALEAVASAPRPAPQAPADVPSKAALLAEIRHAVRAG